MSYEAQPRPRFDEQKAAAELERLQQELEESRRRRKDASAAFDAFVNSFHHKDQRGRTERPLPRPDSRPLAPKLDVPVGMAASGAAGASWQVPARRRAVPVPLILGGVVAIAAGLVLTRAWRTAEEPAASAQPSLATPASGPTLPVAPGAATTAPAAASGGVQAELVALRGVWVRATADGVRVVERELRPDERIPLRAARALVIRAGDAGAVRMSVNGQDRGVLGADGIVVTRTYSAPAGPPPTPGATSR